MPQTPRVRFNFKNLNVQSSVPLLGVVNMVAMTTKGPFEDPSDLISSPSQFIRIFGSGALAHPAGRMLPRSTPSTWTTKGWAMC